MGDAATARSQRLSVGNLTAGVLAFTLMVSSACGGREPLAFDPRSMSDPRSDSFAEFVESHRAALDAPALGLAIVRDGEVMWSGGFGWADYEADRDADADTPFMVASVSKTVVAVAVMQLVEQGMLDLEQPIAPILPFTVEHPEYPDTAITLRMLLLHTSGIADPSDLLYSKRSPVEPDLDLELEMFLRDYLDPSGRYYAGNDGFLTDEPGAVHHYSNVGMALAALVVERTAGQPFYAYAREQIFAPLGMEHTSFRVGESVLAGAAMPYAREELGWRPYGHYSVVPYPVSSLRTSPADLARFLAAIDGGGAIDGVRVLTPRSVAAMLVTAYHRGNVRRTLGWAVTRHEGGELVGHAGDLQGAAADMWLRHSGNAGAIVMCSLQRTDAGFTRSIFALEDALFSIAQGP